MRIADDISPKRKKVDPASELDSLDVSSVHIHLEKETEKPEKKEEEKADAVKAEELFSQKPKDIDGFFPPEKSEKEKPAKKDKTKDKTHEKRVVHVKHFSRNMLLITLCIFLTVLIYAYRHQIIDLFSKDDQQSSSQDTESVTIVPQDYTSEVTGNTTQSTTNSVSDQSTTATPTDNTSAISTTPSVDKTTLTVEVLNGSGVPNSAAKIKSILSDAGYTVPATGNAKLSTYTNTYVYYKSGQEAAAKDIKSVLSSRSVITYKSDSICKTYDIVVVVGKN